MSKTWVRDYMLKSKQERTDKLARDQMAQFGALGLFKMLADQVEQDLKEYRECGGDKLRYEHTQVATFKVFKNTYPSVQLEVSLTDRLVECQYSFKESNADERRTTTAYVRLLSNESGSVQFFKDGEAYSEESEVSEVILTPVLTYLDASE
jgi:hypothetical protein